MQELRTFVTQHLNLSIATALVIILLIVVEIIRAQRNVVQLNPLEATQLINHEKAIIIDLRSQEAYKTGHLLDAISMSHANFNEKLLEKYKNKPLLFICAQGIESQKFAARFRKQGYNAYTLSGGMKAWIDAGMPIVKKT